MSVLMRWLEVKLFVGFAVEKLTKRRRPEFVQHYSKVVLKTIQR